MPTPLKRFLRITPQQLRAFEATARLLSVTQAAKELHVTQPTISVQLRELAEKVGQPLFESAGTGTRLTPVGARLVTTEASIGNCWRDFETWLAEQNSDARQRLSICAETGAECFLPKHISGFEALFPQIDLRFSIGTGGSPLHQLASGACELAVVAGTPPAQLYSHAVVHTAQLVVIAPAHHPLAAATEPLRMDALRDERWFRLEHDDSFHDFEPLRQAALASYDAIWRSVATGLGVASIPLNMLDPASGNREGTPKQSSVAQLQVEGFPYEQSWSLVWRGDKSLGDAADAFRRLLRSDDAPVDS